jgi:hypothetical protein
MSSNAAFQDRTLHEAVKCTQAANLAGRLGRIGLTDHELSDAVTGGNERSDHRHADPCLTAKAVTAVGVKVFPSDLHGIQEDSCSQLDVKIRR